MSTTDTTQLVRDRVLAVRYDGWPALGDDVRLELGRARTVLVGHNAAGKSLLLESLMLGARMAAGDGSHRDPGGPASLTLVLDVEGVRHEYGFVRTVIPPDEESGRPQVEWRERCIRSDTGASVWRTDGGFVVLGDGSQFPLLGSQGMLHSSEGALHLPIASTVERIRRLVRGIRMMRAGIPRYDPIRGPLRLVKQAWGGWLPEFSHGRLTDSMVRLISWFETRMDLFDVVVEICRRLLVLRELSVHVEEIKHRSVNNRSDATHVGEVRVDDVNFGFLSDGTLRVIELILHLIDPRTTVLLLEEPETGIHPGLLQRVLAEIEAYSAERQIVVSTHSLALVDWSHPDEIRLVERAEGKTSVRELSADERARLKFYMEEDLGLADFLFSGAAE